MGGDVYTMYLLTYLYFVGSIPLTFVQTGTINGRYYLDNNGGHEDIKSFKHGVLGI